MEKQVYEALTPVRRRQRWQVALHGAVRGLLGAAVAGILVGLWKFAAGQAVTWQLATGILATGPVVGAIAGLLLRRSWQQAALAVDGHYGLKDRTVTALEFLDKEGGSAFHELQLAEATSHLETVDAKDVVPFRTPNQSKWAVLTAALAIGSLLWPLTPNQVEATTEQPPGIAEAAEIIEQQIEELEQFAEERETEEIKQLVEELQAELDELREPETDVKDALATISEMQAKLAEQQQQYNTALVDSQMNSLSEALESVESFRAAAAEMKAGQYDQAADELEKLQKQEDHDLQRSESRAAGEKLDEVAALMKKSGQSELSESVSELSQGCKSQDSGKICEGCKGLSKGLKKHGLRKSLVSLLQNKLDRLSECKSMCKGGACRKCGSSACKGGNCKKNSLAEGESPDSKNASQSWGKGSHGKIDGDKTQLAGARQLQEITGQAGDGPSEYEVSNSPEGKEQSRRQYKQAYDKYQKMSEAVLESEPIPLGQRQVIRRYFELIRPNQEDVLEDKKTESAE